MDGYTWLGCGSDMVRTWLGRGSDVGRRWVGRVSDLVQTVWQKLRESGFQHSKNFPSAARSRMKIFTKENPVGARNVPTAISRTFPPLVSRTGFPL